MKNKNLNNNASIMKKKKSLKIIPYVDKSKLNKIKENLFQIKHFLIVIRYFVINYFRIKQNQ